MYKLLNSLQPLFTSHVLLYHATFSHVPADMERGLHNVHPEELGKQVTWLKKHFDVVTVDEYMENPSVGRFAVTFDDGYECVFKEAMPILADLSIPFTVFINGSTLEGKQFWRDKVRFLINRSLVKQFLEHCALHGKSFSGLTLTNFYRQSKTLLVSSRQLDKTMDEFLSTLNLNMDQISYTVRSRENIPNHSLFFLGDHSYSHYVLSSLTDKEQEQEISENQRVLKSLSTKLSRVFSIPFGEDVDFTPSTIRLIQSAGYTGFLYSRQRLNLRRAPVYSSNGTTMQAAERYMVPQTFEEFQRGITRLLVKTTLRKR